MAGKLTEEQRQEIVRRYEAGESLGQLAAIFGVTKTSIRRLLRSASVTIRHFTMDLRPGQVLMILEKYRAGHSCRSIAEDLCVSEWAVKREVKTAGIMRDMRAAALSREGKEIASMSQQAWRELYLLAPYPSMSELAERFGVHRSTIRDALRRAGIQPRTISQQKRLDIAMGRYSLTPPRCHPSSASLESLARYRERIKLKGLPKKHLEGIRKYQKAKRQPVHAHCGWCGVPLERFPSQIKKHPRPACCLQHSTLQWNLRRWHGDNEPRPLIVQKLRDLLRADPYRALPFTVEAVEKAGATIGAQEAEVFEVFYEGR